MCHKLFGVIYLVGLLLAPLSAAAQEVTEAVVRGDNISLRSEAGADAELMSILQGGDSIQITGNAESDTGESKPVTTTSLGVSRSWFVPVEVIETGETGWIAEVFVDPRSLNENVPAQPPSEPEVARSAAATPSPDQLETRKMGTLEPIGPVSDSGSAEMVGFVPGGLSPADNGVVSVVKQGRYDVGTSGMVEAPLVVYNGTGETVSGVVALVNVRSAAGDLHATGSEPIAPDTLDPGAYGIAGLRISAGAIPADATFEVSLDWKSGPSTFAPRMALSEVSPRDGRIVGIVTNVGDKAASGQTQIRALCLDGTGTPIGHSFGFAGFILANPLAPGKGAAFQFDLDGGPCGGYLVAVS